MLAFRSEFGLGQDLPIVGNKLKKFIKSFSETNAQLDGREFLDKFTETDGVNAFFMRKPEVFQEFIEDPFKAIESNPELASMAVSFGYEIPK